MSLSNSTQAEQILSTQQFQSFQAKELMTVNQGQNGIETPVKKFKNFVYQANQNLDTANSQQFSQGSNTTAKKDLQKPFLEDISENELFKNFDQHIIVVQDIQDHQEMQRSDISKKLQYLSQNKKHISKLEFSQSPLQNVGSSMKKKPSRMLIESFKGLKLFDTENTGEEHQENKVNYEGNQNHKTPPKRERKQSSGRALMDTPKKENPFRDLN